MIQAMKKPDELWDTDVPGLSFEFRRGRGRGAFDPLRSGLYDAPEKARRVLRELEAGHGPRRPVKEEPNRSVGELADVFPAEGDAAVHLA